MPQVQFTLTMLTQKQRLNSLETFAELAMKSPL